MSTSSWNQLDLNSRESEVEVEAIDESAEHRGHPKQQKEQRNVEQRHRHQSAQKCAETSADAEQFDGRHIQRIRLQKHIEKSQ